MDLYSALILGLLGSLHCAGMCGPIAIALPLSRESWFSRVSGGLLYNSGRTITYVLLGAIFGLAGMGLAVGGLQQVTSIVAGALMILSILIPGLGMVSSRFNKISDPFTRKIKSAFGTLFGKKSMGSLFTLGILNGFLPCGLVYIALAGALVMSHVYEGALYMLLFGLGTIPMMLAISLAGQMISLKLRKRLSRVVPYFIVLLGVLFILRGLNLGIPYVSPKLEQRGEDKVMECCKPKN
jgi:sulfite exporter TauE/SafE